MEASQQFSLFETGHADAHAPLHAPDQRLFKGVDSHAHAVALHMMSYNFVRIH